jgi:hypothetical protein
MSPAQAGAMSLGAVTSFFSSWLLILGIPQHRVAHPSDAEAMAHETELCLLAFPLAAEPGIGIGR